MLQPLFDPLLQHPFMSYASKGARLAPLLRFKKNQEE